MSSATCSFDFSYILTWKSILQGSLMLSVSVPQVISLGMGRQFILVHSGTSQLVAKATMMHKTTIDLNIQLNNRFNKLQNIQSQKEQAKVECMQSHRFFQRFIQNESVTPWDGEENSIFALKTEKFRDYSLQPSKKKLKWHSSKTPQRDYSLINKLFSRKEPLAKIDKKLLARTQTINFQPLANQSKIKNKQMQTIHREGASPFFKANHMPKTNQCSKNKLNKLYERKNRCNSTDLIKSKYNTDFNKIQTIKSKELVLNTNNNFFQPIQSRSKQKYSNRVSEMLSIIRRVMHKEGAIGRIIKKRQKPRLKTEKDRSNLFDN